MRPRADASLATLPPPPAGKRGWPWTAETKRPQPGTAPRGGWPKISIVTPSYNQAEFLEETIRSILLQGYPELEYFIYDGGSSDGSAEIIKKYEPWLAGWASEKDRGQAHAINKGLHRFTGRIAAFLNSDDYYLPGALLHVGRTFAERGCDIFVGSRQKRRLRARVLRRSYWQGRMKPFSFPYMGQGIEWGTSKYPYELPQECVFWDGRKFGGMRFNENYHFFLDAWFFSKIFPGARVTYSSRTVGVFRFHPGQKNATVEQKVGYPESLRLDEEAVPRQRRIGAEAYDRIVGEFWRARSRTRLLELLAPWRDFYFEFEAPSETVAHASREVADAVPQPR